MKTRNLLIAISALALAGCSQNEITEMSPDANPAVGFSVYTGVQTRGVETKLDLLKKTPGTTQGGGFGVLAYYTGTNSFPSDNTSNSYTPNFMYNQKVVWESTSPGAWKYSPLKYWPNTKDDKITFFAYAPYSAAENLPTGSVTAIDNGITLSGNTETGYPELTFTVKGTASGSSDKANAMVDLVVATNKDKERTTENIKFQFEHILSRANFQAKLDKNLTSGSGGVGDGNTYVCVTGARIVGSTSNNDSKFYGKAVYKWLNGYWDYTTGSVDIPTSNYDLGDVLSLIDRSASGLPFDGKNYSTPCVILAQAGTATELFQHNGTDSKTTDEYLFLIPPTDAQDLTSAGGITSEKDVLVEIDYDIITLDAALTNNSNQNYSKTSTKATVSLPNGTLKRGKAYNFIFTIGLEEVKVDADVTAWDTEVDVYAPSVDVTTYNADNVKTAIKAMSDAKQVNPNCNYFIVNINAAATIGSSAGLDLTGNASTNFANFLSGDQIELNFAQNSSVTVNNITVPNGWTKIGSDITSSTGKVILKKTVESVGS